MKKLLNISDNLRVLIGVAFSVAIVSTGLYIMDIFPFNKDNTPPSLAPASSTFQGLIQSDVNNRQFIGFTSNDKATFKVNKHDAIAKGDQGAPLPFTNQNYGLHYVYANEDTTLEEIVHSIDTSAESIAVAIYSAEHESFIITPNTYFSDTIIADIYDLAEVGVSAGQAIYIMTLKDSHIYGASSGLKAPSEDFDICAQKYTGWYNFAASDISATLAPCLNSVKSIWEQTSESPATFKKTSVNVLSKTESEYHLYWVKLDKIPDEQPQKLGPPISINGEKNAQERIVLEWKAPQDAILGNIAGYDVVYSDSERVQIQLDKENGGLGADFDVIINGSGESVALIFPPGYQFPSENDIYFQMYAVDRAGQKGAKTSYNLKIDEAHASLAVQDLVIIPGVQEGILTAEWKAADQSAVPINYLATITDSQGNELAKVEIDPTKGSNYPADNLAVIISPTGKISLKAALMPINDLLTISIGTVDSEEVASKTITLKSTISTIGAPVNLQVLDGIASWKIPTGLEVNMLQGYQYELENENLEVQSGFIGTSVENNGASVTINIKALDYLPGEGRTLRVQAINAEGNVGEFAEFSYAIDAPEELQVLNGYASWTINKDSNTDNLKGYKVILVEDVTFVTDEFFIDTATPDGGLPPESETVVKNMGESVRFYLPAMDHLSGIEHVIAIKAINKYDEEGPVASTDYTVEQPAPSKPQLVDGKLYYDSPSRTAYFLWYLPNESEQVTSYIFKLINEETGKETVLSDAPGSQTYYEFNTTFEDKKGLIIYNFPKGQKHRISIAGKNTEGDIGEASNTLGILVN